MPILTLTAKGYDFKAGNAANGLDFPGLNVDIKVTSIKQPQCPSRRKLLDDECNDDECNDDDIMAFMADRSLTTDEHELRKIAAEVLTTRPEQGYLTNSPALQWRLQYKRVIAQAGTVDGVLSVFKA